VYGQFLEAYKSVMVGTMASAFGVSTEFLDAELSRFIAAGKLNAKIDKVNCHKWECTTFFLLLKKRSHAVFGGAVTAAAFCLFFFFFL